MYVQEAHLAPGPKPSVPGVKRHSPEDTSVVGFMSRIKKKMSVSSPVEAEGE